MVISLVVGQLGAAGLNQVGDPPQAQQQPQPYVGISRLQQFSHFGRVTPDFPRGEVSVGIYLAKIRKSRNESRLPAASRLTHRACAGNGRSAGEKTDRGQPFSNGLHRQRHGKTGIFASRPTGNGFVADIIRKHAAPRKQDRTPCPSRIAGNGMPSNRNTSQQPKRPAYADPTPPFQNFSEARSRPANGFRRASRESAECRRNACLGR